MDYGGQLVSAEPEAEGVRLDRPTAFALNLVLCVSARQIVGSRSAKTHFTATLRHGVRHALAMLFKIWVVMSPIRNQLPGSGS